jgi:hypothetical protein
MRGTLLWNLVRSSMLPETGAFWCAVWVPVAEEDRSDIGYDAPGAFPEDHSSLWERNQQHQGQVTTSRHHLLK